LEKAQRHFLQMIPDDTERSTMDWTMVFCILLEPNKPLHHDAAMNAELTESEWHLGIRFAQDKKWVLVWSDWHPASEWERRFAPHSKLNPCDQTRHFQDKARA
jgi:hypothetical protein